MGKNAMYLDFLEDASNSSSLSSNAGPELKISASGSNSAAGKSRRCMSEMKVFKKR